MDVNERQKIYTLLAQFYPNARQLKDPKTRTAWGLALERFPYAAVKNAVVEYAISNKFFPDLADITADLVPAVPEPPQRVPHAPGPTELEHMERARAWQRQWHGELKQMGLPTLSQALSEGMSPGEWERMLAEAGVFA